MTPLVRLARPKQWIKNVVVFAGVVFAGRLGEPEFVLRAVGAFVGFCILSSAIYVFNDILDRKKDRRHPEKRDRPIAAGQVGTGTALFLSVTLGGFYVYPAAYFRGATPPERILATFAIPFLWAAKECARCMTRQLCQMLSPPPGEKRRLQSRFVSKL